MRICLRAAHNLKSRDENVSDMKKLKLERDLRYRMADALKDGHSAAICRIGSVLARLVPNDTQVFFQYGLGLFRVKRYVEAEKALRRAYELDSNYYSVQYELGNLCRDLGRFDEAESWYRSAIRTRPNSTIARIFLGSLLAHRERFLEACVELEQAVEVEGDVDEAYLNLGLCRRSLGQLDLAREMFQKAISISPDYDDAKLGLADVESAIAVERDFASMMPPRWN